MHEVKAQRSGELFVCQEHAYFLFLYGFSLKMYKVKNIP